MSIQVYLEFLISTSGTYVFRELYPLIRIPVRVTGLCFGSKRWGYLLYIPRTCFHSPTEDQKGKMLTPRCLQVELPFGNLMATFWRDVYEEQESWPWNQRALLSHRLLYFTEQHFHFKCNSAVFIDILPNNSAQYDPTYADNVAADLLSMAVWVFQFYAATGDDSLGRCSECDSWRVSSSHYKFRCYLYQRLARSRSHTGAFLVKRNARGHHPSFWISFVVLVRLEGSGLLSTACL